MLFEVPSGSVAQAFQSPATGKRMVITNPQSTGIFYSPDPDSGFTQLVSTDGRENPELKWYRYNCIDREGRPHHLDFDGEVFTFDDERYDSMPLPSEFEYEPIPEAMRPRRPA